MQKTLSSGNLQSVVYNWPTVLFLLLLTAIPAIPGLFILITLFVGTDTMGQEVASMVNPLYFNEPQAIMLHAGSGLLFFINMPLQFSAGVRLKCPMIHKLSGYVTVVSGCVLALSGIWMHHFLNQGVIDSRYVSLSLQSVAVTLSFVFAVKHVLRRNLKSHRIWMSRAVAISLSLVSLVFIELVLMIFLGEYAKKNGTLIQVLHDFGNLLGMAINLLAVEFIYHSAKN